jgi:putative MATE family efflux protein
MLHPNETIEELPLDEPEAPAPGLWATIREAVRGSHDHDYTEGPIGRSILLLSVPMVLETLMESIFAVVDVYYVGHLGADAIATVGLTEAMLTIMYTIAIGLGIGATAMVARRIGERDADGAAHTAAQAIWLGIVLSILIGIPGALFAPDLLRLMDAPASVVATGSGFTRMMFAGNASILLLFLVNAIFRGAGDAAIAMRVLWLANAINIVLAPLLIFGPGPFPELGVTGAAVATTIGRGTGAVYAVSRLFRDNGRIRVERRHLRPDPALMWRMFRLSGSGMFQVFIGMASWLGLVRIISRFGADALAGFTIGMRVIMFALLPSWGMSNAAATMVGQALGAGKPDRAEQAVWMAGLYNMVFLGAVGVAFVVFAGPIAGIFTAEPGAHAYGAECLRIVACGFLFYAYGMVITQSFNGAGDTWTPTKINLVCFWLGELPVGYLLAVPFGMGPRGVFLSMTIAFSALAVVSAVIFRRGSWKTQRV